LFVSEWLTEGSLLIFTGLSNPQGSGTTATLEPEMR